METKPALTSKTLWLNAGIAAVVAACEVLKVALPLEIVAFATPLLNLALRWLSHKRLTVN